MAPTKTLPSLLEVLSGSQGKLYLLLEDRLDPAAPATVFRNPVNIVRCDEVAAVDESLDRIEAGLASGLHAAGLVSYELGYALERRLTPLMPPLRGAPLLWFGLFETPEMIAAPALDEAFARIGPPRPLRELRPGHSRAEHVAKVTRILGLIAAGDLYQANLTFPMVFQYEGDPLTLYGALRTRQPVAHGGFASLGDRSVLSVSPELWIRTIGDQATMRPMKGTAPRGSTQGADEEAKSALIADDKQRAENLMIVDLLRNDLARICEPATVRVPALFTAESYPTFHTLTSTVTGKLRLDLSLRAKLSALFPCGSIVGAPKIRAGEVVRALEPEPRGFYTGALGHIAPNGDLNFNVSIRTAVLSAEGDGRYGVGGGIVADSNPDAEYDEALLKARVLTRLADDFELIETFRWSGQTGFVRLSLHLDRLGASAQQLGFEFDRCAAELALEKRESSWKVDGDDRRVRLLLGRTGRTTVTGSVAPRGQIEPLKVLLSDHRVDPGDPYLRHKTTWREVYDSEHGRAATLGADEILFLNRRGEVAEASRSTVFAELDGRLVTPPLSCGLLPGVLRQVMISEGRAFEVVLTVEDLKQAASLYLGNSLHGLRPMVLHPGATFSLAPLRSVGVARRPD